jgi:hypothetical protein
MSAVVVLQDAMCGQRGNDISEYARRIRSAVICGLELYGDWAALDNAYVNILGDWGMGGNINEINTPAVSR